MRTKIEVSIVSEIAGLKFGYWNEKADVFTEVDETNHESLDNAAKALGCSRELVESITTSINTLSQAIHQDLLDVWERLDQMEKRLAQKQAQ